MKHKSVAISLDDLLGLMDDTDLLADEGFYDDPDMHDAHTPIR